MHIPIRRHFQGLTRNTFLLAFTSFFSDVATEMMYPVLPVFLTQVLLAPASIVGIIEGVAMATQNIVQGFSGWVSDKLRRHKGVALAGFTLAALAKPLIGLAQSWPEVLGARFVDRLGTGVRSAPRDALIASSTDERHRGSAFGLEGVGDNLGACVGPLVAVLLLFVLGIEIRLLFLLAVIPALLGILTVMFVSEKQTPTAIESGHPAARSVVHAPAFPVAYWKYLVVTAIFGMGNSSSAFLILRARQLGISFELTILLYAGVNLSAALISFPAGVLADVLGRRTSLVLSFLLFALSFGGFAVASTPLAVGILFMLYGVSSGMYRAIGKATATDFVPEARRASAVGWYAATVGLSALAASTIAGQLWTRNSPSAVFVYGLICALLGIAFVFIMAPIAVTTPRSGRHPLYQP